jgi:hypothetical protein
MMSRTILWRLTVILVWSSMVSCVLLEIIPQKRVYFSSRSPSGSRVLTVYTVSHGADANVEIDLEVGGSAHTILKNRGDWIPGAGEVIWSESRNQVTVLLCNCIDRNRILLTYDWKSQSAVPPEPMLPELRARVRDRYGTAVLNGKGEDWTDVWPVICDSYGEMARRFGKIIGQSRELPMVGSPRKK